MNKLEILAPSGDIKSLKAAFLAGADAVYFGVSDFNARKRATNIDKKLLSLIVAEAYQRGIKLYLTINTLITSLEIPKLLDLIDTALISGIKVFIVQDYGILYLLKRYYPEAEIHVSTQTTTHLKGQIEFLSTKGVSRINLSRELSFFDVSDYTHFAHELGVETEVFIHGSYCLSFSGQCYLSSFLEGLSGNRGYCAQLCRRSYKKEKNKGYYLNLKDNNAFVFAEKLALCGVDSLKIEGRIKGSSYVYTTVKTWKEFYKDSPDKNKRESAADDYQIQLGSVFNRGFTSGYLEESISRDMLSKNPSDSSYKKFSTVKVFNVKERILELNMDATEKLPVSIVIKRPGGDFVCQGNLLELRGRSRYLFEIEGQLKGKILSGDCLYKREGGIYKDQIDQTVDQLVFKKIPVKLVVRCKEGEPFSLCIQTKEKTITTLSKDIIVKASTRATSQIEIENQLSKMGNTPFEVKEINFEVLGENLFVPSSLLKKLRRKAVSLFLETIDEKRSDKVVALLAKEQRAPEETGSSMSFIVDYPVLGDSLLKEKAGEVFYEVGNPEELIDQGFIPFYPAVMEKNYAEACLHSIKSGAFFKIVANNTAMIQAAKSSGTKWIAGDSLNITNWAAVEFFKQIEGHAGSFISPELGRQQVKEVVDSCQSSLYFSLYQRPRLLTTRQCLLDYRCGRKESDRGCFSRSCGNDLLKDVKGKEVLIEKREYRYTELYNKAYYFPFQAVSDFQARGLSFVVDLRIFPKKTENKPLLDKKMNEQMEIYRNMKSYIDHPQSRNAFIEDLFLKTSPGNYIKGLL